LKKLCEQAHGRFVKDVKRQRGNKIKDDPTTFSGEVFVGQ
jgi:ClpP class serine protease